MSKTLFIVLAAGALAQPTLAQSRYLIADRTNDAIYELIDLNASGVIDEPGEVRLFFNGTNAAGSLALMNSTALGTNAGGAVAIGDQGNRNLYVVYDLNRDGDGLDIGESFVLADATNVSGISFAFPTGVDFDSLNRLYVVNAGNGFGNDGVYRLTDLNGDGDSQDAGEITVFIGEPVFGAGNGIFSPQELIILPGPPIAGYLRDSGPSTRGVYRFADLDDNGRADDLDEFAAFFDGTNQSGVAISAGFAVDLDRAHPDSLYILQTVTGGIDQVIRLTDANQDGDAQDLGEALLVYETAETGFTSVDLFSTVDGRVLVTDNSSKRVIALTDLDQDGLFTGLGERTSYFSNSALVVGDVRQISPMPRICRANCDESTSQPVLNVADFTCFLQAFAGGSLYANCDSSAESPVLNVADFTCFLQAFAAGCP